MRTELLALLRQAGVVGLERDVASWSRVLLVRSRGSLIRRRAQQERNIADRGFHLIVLGRDGAPAYYCKCRPALPDGALHRETEILRVLATDPGATRHVPHPATARNARIDLQVTPYVKGVPLDLRMPRLDPEARWGVAQEVLDVVDALARAVRKHLDRLGKSRTISLADEATGFLGALSPMGVAEGDRRLIDTVLDGAGSVPAVPQHGDLWPQNVVVEADGSIRIVDMDGFGLITAPLFDVLHFMRTARESAPERAGLPLAELLLAADVHGPAMRRVLRAEAQRHALSPAQVGACALFYVVGIAATTFLREVPPAIWRPFRDQIAPMCSAIRSTGSTEAYGRALLA